MDIMSSLKNIRVSDKKMRLVINQIRGVSVFNALNVLIFSKKKSAKILKKLLESAVSNAESNYSLDINNLYVTHACSDKGSIFKRFSARAKGRGDKIMKKNCNVTIKVGYKIKVIKYGS